MSVAATKILMGSGATEETDDDFELVNALYHFDGTNGGDNNTFLDSSSNSITIGRNGNTTQGTFTPFSADDGKWSNKFTEISSQKQYLYIENQSSLAPGTSDYTVEFWVYLTGSTANQGLFQLDTTPLSSNTYIGPVIFTGGGLYAGRWATMKQYGGNATLYADSSFNPSANTWYHAALVRNSGTVKLYIDGVEAISFSDSADYSDRDSIVIGSTYSTTYNMTGYISNFRYVKGTAVYTSAFTPPTTPLTNITNTQLFTCRSSGFIDDSSTGHTITRAGDLTASANQECTSTQPFSPFAPSASYSTANNGGAADFDRTGDYLTAQDSDLAFGTGDFTVEGWVRFSPWSVSTYSGRGIFHITTGHLNSTVYGPALGVDNSGNWHIYHVSGATALSYGPAGNEWYHFAWVRNSSTSTVYINGASVWSASDSNDYTWSYLVVGGYYSSSFLLDGYVSNFRIVKGTAVYTSAFTPPTSAPTAISGTELLLNFTNGSAFDNSGKTLVETEGSAQLSTSEKKFGSASLHLDGSSDALIGDPNSRYLVGTGHFTAECWFYQSAAAGSGSSSHILLSQWGGASGTKAFMFGVWNTNMALWASNDGSTNNISAQLSSAGIVSTSQWHHAALTWDGSTYRVFLDGTEVIAVSNSSGLSEVDQPLQIGRGTSGGSAYGRFDGYIDEVRITRKARYTSNFTVPTKAFPNR